MGLDMYLEARKYVAKYNWEQSRQSVEPVVSAEYQAILSGLPEGIDEFDFVYRASW